MNLGFTLLASSGGARTGRFKTTHGEVRTPVFMPVGTQASVKGVLPRDLRELGAEVVLGNAYHLFLRPGHELIRELGGLHAFMGWERSILTDSGGYQVLSLAELRKVEEDGVTFRSHLDGSLRRLTPEVVMEVQNALGSDIAMPLDVCPAGQAPQAEVELAVERSLRWLRRCRAAHRRGHDQALFGIVQGGTDAELRRRSAGETVELDLDGYAIGGLAVGEDRTRTRETVARVAESLPTDRPRYLMGMGTPQDLVEAVAAGVDMFDSVLPTRNARNGGLFTSAGRLNIRNARYARDPRPLDPRCAGYCCRTFSRAYLRHLFVAREILAPVVLTMHNLQFYLDTMESIRQAISAQRFEELRRAILDLPGGPAAGDAVP